MKSLLKLLLLIITYPSYADVTVTWSIFDTIKPDNYDQGENVLKAPSVTRVAHSQNCYSLYVIVYEDNSVTVRLVAKTKAELQDVPQFRVVKQRVKSRCKGHEYSFSAKSVPIEEEKKLFDQG